MTLTRLATRRLSSLYSTVVKHVKLRLLPTVAGTGHRSDLRSLLSSLKVSSLLKKAAGPCRRRILKGIVILNTDTMGISGLHDATGGTNFNPSHFRFRLSCGQLGRFSFNGIHSAVKCITVFTNPVPRGAPKTRRTSDFLTHIRGGPSKCPALVGLGTNGSLGVAGGDFGRTLKRLTRLRKATVQHSWATPGPPITRTFGRITSWSLTSETQGQRYYPSSGRARDELTADPNGARLLDPLRKNQCTTG